MAGKNGILPTIIFGLIIVVVLIVATIGIDVFAIGIVALIGLAFLGFNLEDDPSGVVDLTFIFISALSVIALFALFFVGFVFRKAGFRRT